MTNRLQEQLYYVYDAAHNLNYRTNNALAETFSVNGLNELTNIGHSGTLTVAGTTTSPATNVTVNGQSATLYMDNTFARANVQFKGGNNTFTAIAKDHYGRVDTNIVTAYLPNLASYTNDLNGNLLSDGTRNLAYDDENQLSSVWVTNVWRSDFVYDGRMRRRIRREYTWSGSSWVEASETHYIYDGNVVIQERDWNNLPQVTYTRGNDLSGRFQGAGGIGGLLARTDNTKLLLTQDSTLASACYHSDGNGNVTCLIYTNQFIAAKYLYDPFGNTLSASGPLAEANLYRFSSKEYHPNSGLVYYLYRFYDPNLQRWVNRDPFNESGFELLRGRMRQNKAELNLYQFENNDSTDRIDPLGLVDSITETITYCATRSGGMYGFGRCLCLFADDTEKCEKELGACLDAIGTRTFSDSCHCFCSRMADPKQRSACDTACDVKFPKKCKKSTSPTVPSPKPH